MDFGIMEMQMELLVPRDGQAVHPGSDPFHLDHARLIQFLRQAGFRLIELGGDLELFFPDSFQPESIAKLLEIKRRFGLRYTLHLPLWSVEPSTPLAPVRKGSVESQIHAITCVLPLEPEQIVMHATGSLAAEFYQMRLPEPAKPVIMRQFQKNAIESIRMILAETGIVSRRLAIETIEFPFDLTTQIADELDLSICLDTGHVLVGFSGPIRIEDALELCLPRLGEIHLHDGPWQGAQRSIGYGKDHQPLGKGDLNVGWLLKRLNQANWKGPVIFELSVQQALESLQIIYSIIPDLNQGNEEERK